MTLTSKMYPILLKMPTLYFNLKIHSYLLYLYIFKMRRLKSTDVRFALVFGLNKVWRAIRSTNTLKFASRACYDKVTYLLTVVLACF